MTDPAQDTQRSIAAAKLIIDGRDPRRDMSKILVTAEQTVAAILLMTMGDPRKAAGMLNEGFLQGVEQRLVFYQSKQDGKP